MIFKVARTCIALSLIALLALPAPSYAQDKNDSKQEKQKHNEPFFEMRIGIHSGPVTAGVVGYKKFAYDIWGDTVNIASRMESNGEPGKINISSSTHSFIKDKYECIHRGKISAKNIGEVDMYFVHAEVVVNTANDMFSANPPNPL